MCLKSLLSVYLDVCFNLVSIPSLWLKAISVPIPKSASKRPCVPLNYRGVSLFYCVYKVYSAILNISVTGYLEDIDFF